MANNQLLVIVTLFFVNVKSTPTSQIHLGEIIQLHCPVHTQGRDFSVKSITWLKDDNEFYKYDPKISHYAMIITVDGVEIQEDTYFNGTLITIGPATLKTAGFYRCTAKLFNPHLFGFKLSLNVDSILTFTQRQIHIEYSDEFDYETESARPRQINRQVAGKCCKPYNFILQMDQI